MNPLLNKIVEARATAGGNHIKDGRYIFTIDKVLSESKRGGNMFIVEFLVEESQSYADLIDNGKPVIANAPGSRVSWVLNLDKNDSAGGNIKAFVLALYGETEEAVDAEELQAKAAGKASPLGQCLSELVSAVQPARGMRIADATFRKTIRGGLNAGKPFTGHNWAHVPMTPEQIKSRRDELEKKAA